jgi:hypothetical protein
VPPHIDAAVRKSLEKLPADRFENARAFAAALTDTRLVTTAAVASVAASVRRSPTRLTIALGSALAFATAVAAWALTRPAPPAAEIQVVRFSLNIGAEQRYLGSGPGETRWGVPIVPSMALSPDGKLLAYAAWEVSGANITSRLYVRRLSEALAQPVVGSESAFNHFFSPDGTWIGFFANGSLKRVPMSGGAPETIVPGVGPNPLGATWGDDGTIVYAESGTLYRVAASGGTPAVVLPADTTTGSGLYAMPHFLPGSRLALVGIQKFHPAKSSIVVLDLQTRQMTTLLSNGLHPVLVATGHLLFVRQGTLMAVGFDSDGSAIRGEPVAVLEGVSQATNMPNTAWETGAGQFAASASGHLAFAGGGVYESPMLAMVRVTRDGKATALGVEAPRLSTPRISPAGDRVLFHARSSTRSSATTIFVRDLERGVTTRVAGDAYVNQRPVWSPDGQTILFSSDREDDIVNLYTIAADGGGSPKRLARSQLDQMSASWGPDGTILFLQDGDIWALPPRGAPVPFITSRTAELFPTFSPDGHWIAYTTDETGRSEVYVRPFPGPEPATQISSSGGSSPAWSADGSRLFYMHSSPSQPRASIMVVDVSPGATFRAGRAVTYIQSWPYQGSTPIRGYDIAKDGSIVAVTLTGGRVAGDERNLKRIGEIHIVLNFLDELRARVK